MIRVLLRYINIYRNDWLIDRSSERASTGVLGGGGGWTPIWNRRRCSSEILNLTPKGDHLGVAQAFCDP